MVVEYFSKEALSVKFFDTITSFDPSVRGDVEFYASFLRSSAEQVLDLGCGTGRIAIALGAKGHLVIGVDTSEAMLRRGRAKCQALPLSRQRNLQLLCCNLVTLALPVRFNLVIASFYTFNHLGNRQQRAQALLVIAKHLMPGARAIIHAASPDALRERRIPRRPGNIFKFEDVGTRLEVTWAQRIVDEKQRTSRQIVEYQLIGADGGIIESSEEQFTYRWFSDSEIKRSAEKAGLELEQILTSFDSAPGRERIYVLRKPT